MSPDSIPTAQTPRVHSISAAARQIGVSRSFLYSLEKAGLIRFGRLLGKTVITQREIDRLIASLERDEVA